MINKFDNKKITQQFKDLTTKYEKLGLNLTQALELLLKEMNIPYLSISYRIKESDSFIGKIERKNYLKPFEEIEDICGVRIICYYQSDVEKIKNVIFKELDVIDDENKEENLEFDQFGYRSMHFIVKIKKNWLNTPNYRGLENLKAELQIRTILMHAWAEIEHKLAYKSKSQIPKEFRRKLSRISAKLEESDEQFEDIKNLIEQNKTALIESANESEKFDSSVEFNLDNLQAFLDYAFPDRDKDIKLTRGLFEEMIENNISLKTLSEGFEKTKKILRDVEKEGASLFFKETYDDNILYLIQVGAARMILDLVDEQYFNSRIQFKDEEDIELTNKYKSLLK